MNDERGRGLAVLTYHAFAPRRSVTVTDPAWFAETIETLVGSGCHGVDLAEWVARGRPDEPNGFALAFDDGLVSILDVAGLVERLRLPATVFVAAGRVGRDNDWPGPSRGVSRERLLGWRELDALAASGFRIASHGSTHTPLVECDPTRLNTELRISRDVIEQRIGRNCPLIAYPYGRSSPRVREAAARVYTAAFGTRLGHADMTQDPFDLYRIDAYYLSSRRTLDALVHDRWRGPLRWRQTLRAVRAGASRVVPQRRAHV